MESTATGTGRFIKPLHWHGFVAFIDLWMAFVFKIIYIELANSQFSKMKCRVRKEVGIIDPFYLYTVETANQVHSPGGL